MIRRHVIVSCVCCYPSHVTTLRLPLKSRDLWFKDSIVRPTMCRPSEKTRLYFGSEFRLLSTVKQWKSTYLFLYIVCHIIKFLQCYMIYISVPYVPSQRAIQLKLQSLDYGALAALLPDVRSIRFAGHMLIWTLCSSIMQSILHMNLTDFNP